MIPGIEEKRLVNGVLQNGWPSYATLHQASVSLQDMGDRVITTQVRIDGDVVPDFSGWELYFKGERFVLPSDNPQASKDNTTRNSLVDLQFQSWPIQELKRYYFFEAASVSAGVAIADKYVAPVRLNVEDFMVMLNKVLKYYFGNKIVADLYMSGQGIYSQEPKIIEINYSYLWDVVCQVFEIYGVRNRIEYNSTTGVYTIKFGYPAPAISDHDFEYGYQGGLLKFERQVQDESITNILLGRGGEKNLPYRYFKKTDPQNPNWAADPDAIPELQNIYFDRLRDINFRWYVRGWMHNPNRDTSGDEAWDPGHVFPTYTISSDSPYYWAYQKGLTDTEFNPVEFVKDDDSIDAYGERWGAADDNDEIYPTIQGRYAPSGALDIGRIDEVVAVSEIETDDIAATAAASSVEKSIDWMIVTYPSTNPYEIKSDWFEIPTGQTGNIRYSWVGPTEGSGVTHIDTAQSSLVAIDENGTAHPISGLPAGRYQLRLSLKLYIPSGYSAAGSWGLENIVLTTSAEDANAWKPTFDIWVKNIWNTEKGSGETDEQYAARVWEDILGDRAGNEAKVVFSTGFMSVSEDYEFVIASYPVFDQSKSIQTTDAQGNTITVPSEWRITLRKCDAEYDATGLFIPNATTGGQPLAGDKFFFTGIDMPFLYVTLGEEQLNSEKSASLDDMSVVNPTWVISLDKVRVHTLEEGEYGQTLADRLAAGAKLNITDPRFSGGDVLTLYAQSITYTWNEPSDNSPYIVPDIEVVLSDKVISRRSRTDRMESSIEEIKTTYARLDDVERVVRSVAEPLFLKKTGEADSSDSPTQFSSKVSSKGFRQGGVGGNGWGFYLDNTEEVAEGEEGNGDTVLEVDRVVVRKDLHVNSLVANQTVYRGGREVQSAAKIECTKVVVDDSGKYVCYFDQKQGSVKNLFIVGDFAYSTDFAPDNTVVKYYRRRVDAVDVDRIVLSDTIKDGAGVPAAGDMIIQYGHESNAARQYVIVRDVIGGGYERMISGLSTVSANGDEYYFAGRQTGQYYNLPRWFVGSAAGEYAEYLNGQLNIKGRLQVLGESGSYADIGYLADALPKKGATLVQGGLVLTSMIQLGQVENNAFKVYSGINGVVDATLADPTKTIAAWYGGEMLEKATWDAMSAADKLLHQYAKTIYRFDGSGYLAGGNIYWDENGYGGIPGITWSRPAGAQNDVITIGADVMLEQTGGTDSSVTELITLVRSVANMFEDESYQDGNSTKHRIKVRSGFEGLYTNGFLSAGGVSSGGGQAGGNASMSLITGGGRFTNGTDTLDVYSMTKVDQLLASAGTVQTVAGVSPVSGDIPVASLSTALGLGAAASYGIGSVASGNTGLVTGGAVWSAIDALPEPMVFKGSLGTGGTITSLPVNGTASIGDTYKVITAGTYAGKTAKVGDTFICDSKTSSANTWTLIPSGDEPSGTVTSVGLTVPTGLSVSGSPITTSGTLAITFASGYSIPTTANQTAWSNKYDKPSGGIPSSDLASAVQTSLGYADTLNGYFTNGVLGVANGGTGKSSWTKYGVVYASGTTTLAQVSNNTTDTKKFLRMTGTGSAAAAPAWDTVAFSDLPALYIGTTAVQSSSASQALTGITTGAFSSYITIGSYVRSANYLYVGYGNAPSSSEASSVTQKRRIYFGDTSHYIELDSSGYFHFSHGLYSDSFVSAGGVSSGGGSTGIDLDAMWQSLTTTTDTHGTDKIAVGHIPDMASTYGYLKASSLSVSGGTAESGKYISALSYSNGVFSVTKATLPSYSAGTGITINSSNQISVTANTYVTLATEQTITGKKTFEGSGNDILTINRTGSNNPWIRFQSAGTIVGFIGISPTDNKAYRSTTTTPYALRDESDTYVTSGKGYIGGSEITTISGNAATATSATKDGAGNIISTYYLPLSGGTMTGHLIISHTSSRGPAIYYKNGRVKSDGGIWADNVIAISNAAESVIASIGMYGSGDTLNYLWLGQNAYNGDNLRVYSDKLQFGDNVIYHSGNSNLTTIPWSAQALTLAGAITGATTINASTSVTSPKFYLDANNYFEVVDGKVHLHVGTGGGFYTDGFISAGGLSSGGGSGGIDPAEMWAYLTNTATDTSYNNTKIADAHIPDLASTYGYQKASDVSSAISTAITALNLGTASTHAHSDYVTAVGWDSTNKKLTWSKGSTAQTAITIGFATSATTASKLSNTTKVGDTNQPVYFTANGVPAAISYTIGKSVPSDAVFTDTTYSAGTGLTLTGTTFSISQANVSTIINLLTTGSAAPTDDDYYIAQYAGGGTTTTTYHRRPHSALYTYIKGKLDSVYVPQTRTVNSKALSANITLTLDDIADGSARKLASYLPLAGGTMTGVLTAKGAQYEDSYSGALNMNNSNIYGLNAIYTADASNNQSEGIHFYRDETHVDTLRAASGALYFAPNRTLDSSTTEYTVYHSGNSNLTTVNWSAKALTIAGAITGATTITASGQVTVGSLKLGSNTPTLSWDSNANAWHLTGNFYADGFISAGGLSSGGGSSGIDEAAMWAALGRNTDPGTNKKIHTAHLPALTANNGLTAAYSGTPDSTALTIGVGSSYKLPLVTEWNSKADASSLANYLPLAGGTMSNTNVVTNLNADYLDGHHRSYYDTLLAYYSTTDSANGITYPAALLKIDTPDTRYWYVHTSYYSLVGGSNYSQFALSYDQSTPRAFIRHIRSGTATDWTELLSMANFSVTLNGTGTTSANLYAPITAGASGQVLTSSGSGAPSWVNQNTLSVGDSTKLNGQAASYYATASDVTTLQGYFTNGVANNANSLGGIAAANYWHNGNSGTASHDWAAKDLSAAGTLSVTGATTLSSTLGVTDAATLSSTLSVAGSSTLTGAVSCGSTFSVASTSTFSDNVVISKSGGGTLYITNTTYNNSDGSIIFVDRVGTQRNGCKIASVYSSTSSRQDLVFYRSNNTTSPYTPEWIELLRLKYNGYVNINAPSSTPCTVNVNGTLWTSTGMYSDGYVSAGGLSTSSDARLKDNIKDFSYSTALLMAIKPREWDWNELTPMKGHAAGFVAQEIENLLPYAVTERTYKQLTYDTFHALEIAGLQDHETRIQQLERENKELRKKVSELERTRLTI